jgi:DNA-binding NtrC family response regulator
MESKYKVKVFVIEDDAMHFKLIKLSLDEEVFDVSWFTNGKEFLDKLNENPEIIVLDHMLPDMSGLEILRKIHEYNTDLNVIFFSGQEDVAVVVEAYKLGAKNYIIKNQNAFIEFKNAIKNINNNLQLKKEVEYLREIVVDRKKYINLIGESAEMLKVLRLIQKVEKSTFLTLITGESGTGKELVAQAIHNNSNRGKKPFVAVNVSAIPNDLVESEIFGHEKGAFTGADSKRIGKFEEADGGTIFLDEIGDMDLQTQTKLLRVLQESKITRLGSNKEIQLDVRVLLATHKNLFNMVKEGKFREDLFYRIQGFLIDLPPLRERGNDVVVLAKHFVNEFCEKNRIPIKTIDKDAMKKIVEHTWPGNVRELKAVMERGILISDTNVINTEDLVFSGRV